MSPEREDIRVRCFKSKCAVLTASIVEPTDPPVDHTYTVMTNIHKPHCKDHGAFAHLFDGLHKNTKVAMDIGLGPSRGPQGLIIKVRHLIL